MFLAAETRLTVTGTERLGPGMVRLRFRAEDLSAFAASIDTDRYLRLVLPQPDGTEVVRTYTALDPSPRDGTLSIDFVVHGTEGYAGPWAAQARPGDTLTVRGPGGTYRPDLLADWHLLAGDESGLPAIRAALAVMPADARGYAVVEVPSLRHVQALRHPAGIEVHWLTGGLVGTVRALPWLPGRVHAFVHGEAQAVMQGVRPYLLWERGVPRDDLSISGYWRRDNSEDAFRRWKREQMETVKRA